MPIREGIDAPAAASRHGPDAPRSPASAQKPATVAPVRVCAVVKRIVSLPFTLLIRFWPHQPSRRSLPVSFAFSADFVQQGLHEGPHGPGSCIGQRLAGFGLKIPRDLE